MTVSLVSKKHRQ